MKAVFLDVVLAGEIVDLPEIVSPEELEADILGEGDVGMETYVRTLGELGYTGPLTIEREIAQDPDRQKAEIGQAVGLLKELKGKIA